MNRFSDRKSVSSGLYKSHFNYLSIVGKKRIIKKYEQLSSEVLSLISETYPDGYEDLLISIPLPSGELALALPLETDEVSYLIRMPSNSAPENTDESDSVVESADDIGKFESLEAAEDIADED